MIQRIQTIYIIIISILSFVLLTGPVINFSGPDSQVIMVKLTGILGLTGIDFKVDFLLNIFLILLIASIVFSLTAIFLFKKRKLQFKLTTMVAFFALVITVIEAYITLSILKIEGITLIPGFKMFIPPVLIILACLALKGIKHDEKLIKSYERLR
ncbi:MAG TPA: DUF4293 family protein [Bacteroidales bacterium]|nr:DUF4293 family protein [Bacteroidales bacterium]HCI55906.1 hypothetical protein [Bacteroidales bacterium]HOU95084.1 DUF4293 family protein [Bacteroidales bacterium]HQG36426.1 DUF4293 family protein [Bacteroidales bacterium]HQG53668.1 DUF4293 family protein [Bacteroidales bacterium]